jgi:glycosyltransferase involved in cell wall biosynthesis
MESGGLKIAYITAGAAGMYCGSCMHDNTLAAALIGLGHDALLIPTYTPIRTDEDDVSQRRVFFGGINVYLQQKLAFFRHTPWLFDRLFDWPRLLRWVSRFAVKTQAQELGELTVSMLQGEHGKQKKEVAKLVRWLADDVKPDVVTLTNAILSGMVHELKRTLGVPILCALQGDDIYTESLPEPSKSQTLALIRDHCKEIDGFLATCRAYADFMSEYFAIAREKIHVVYPGLNLKGHGGPRPDANGRPFTIGYFARICHEKGLHLLAEAYRLLRQSPGCPPCRLRISGWLGDNHRAYFDGIMKSLADAGLASEVLHVESPGHDDKVRFLHSIDVLSVPAPYREPKGLYILEALANGVPVVQPRHGSFPELIELTGGGLLVNPADPADLARGLRELLHDPVRVGELGRRGRDAVHSRFHAEQMARETVEVFRHYVQQ